MNLKSKFKRLLSGALSLAIIATVLPSIPAAAEETEKYPYAMFGRNSITISAESNICVNGAVHTNKEADVSYLNGNINGKVTTGSDIEKRVKHVYADTKIKETYFTENCDLHEEEYVYSNMNNLKQLNYYKIEEEKNISDNVIIIFSLKSFDKFDYQECAKDIYTIKENINAWISDEEYGLCNKLIRIVIKIRPGEVVYVYNYNFLEGDKEKEHKELSYYKNLSVNNLSLLNYFNDSYVLGASVHNVDNVKIFKNFYNIEYLNIYEPFTDKEQQQLLELLSNCTIICNGKTINKENVNSKY